MNAIENARATRARIDERLTVSRIGKSTMREMDRDMLALKEAGEALDALIAERFTPDDDEPARRCRECAESKHGACNGEALIDDGRDVLTVDCICASGGRQ
jgi:hypothetical protein